MISKIGKSYLLYHFLNLEARVGIEPASKDLQSSA